MKFLKRIINRIDRALFPHVHALERDLRAEQLRRDNQRMQESLKRWDDTQNAEREHGRIWDRVNYYDGGHRE